MSQKPELGNQKAKRASSSLPKTGSREMIRFRDESKLDGLSEWMEKQLDELTSRFVGFESPSSNKKFYTR